MRDDAKEIFTMCLSIPAVLGAVWVVCLIFGR